MNTEGGDTAISIPTQRSQLMMSMSSMGGESLQEVWKMLDDARPSPTPRLSSPGAMQRAARFQGNLSRDMSFQTMWYVQPAKAQTSLGICTV